jgi:hypothetical protein
VPAELIDPARSGDVGDTWRSWLIVADLDSLAAAPDAVSVAVSMPDGATVAGTATAQTATGLYLLEYDLAAAGEHRIVVTVTSTTFGDDVLTLIVEARAVTGTRPDMSAVKAYLGDTSYTDEEISDALAAETAAQARACRIPADYPEDLAQALKRRVARNLAARAVPVASFTSFEGGGTSTRVPKRDAEIARFEAPFLRLVTG